MSAKIIAAIALFIGLGLIGNRVFSVDGSVKEAEAYQEAPAPEDTDIYRHAQTLPAAVPHDLPVPSDSLADDRTVAQRIADLTLAARVRKTLFEVQDLRPRLFDVSVREAMVTLRGSVESAEERETVVRLVRRIGGVHDVVDELSGPDTPPRPASPPSSSVAASPAAPPPASSRPTPATATKETAPPPASRSSTQQPSSSRPAPSQPNASTRPAPGAAVLHTVQAGETLWSIATRYGITVDRVKQLNGLADNTIEIGRQLRVQ